MNGLVRTSVTAIILLGMSGYSYASKAMGDIGKFAKWSKIEIAFEGPQSDAVAGESNPFEIETTVRFTAPRGERYKKIYDVPAYFDGDGKGGLQGPVWKVRFAADEVGTWSFTVRSQDPALNGYTGSFEVVPQSEKAPLLYRHGRLEFSGARYLNFADGPQWLKGGADSPENFLGKAMGDWNRKRQQVDYLVEQGVNCVYIMTNNVRGDNRDVWPWIGETDREAMKNPNRFDVGRLRRWQDFLEYIQERGIVIQIVLNDDSAWLGYDHRLYLREMVARFGYLTAIYWNIGEEYKEAFKSWEAGLRYAKLLAELDPYDHPIAIHNVNEPLDEMILDPDVNVTSIQTKDMPPERINALALRWRKRSEELNRPIVVMFDEGRPAMDRRSVWAAFMGGAGWEAIDNTIEKTDNGSFDQDEAFWREMRIAREFVEAAGVWEMAPANNLTDNGFCLADPGKAYLLYAPGGGEIRLDLREAKGAFGVTWLNPKTGESIRAKEEVGAGDWVSIGRAPFDGDAAALVK